MRIVETRNSSFIVSARQDLSENIQPVFTMLNQIQGVSGSRDSTKQGGDEDEKIKVVTDQKDNEASGSGKRQSQRKRDC